MRPFFFESLSAIFLIIFHVQLSFCCLPASKQNFGSMLRDTNFLINTTRAFTCSLFNDTLNVNNVTHHANCSNLMIKFKQTVLDSRCIDPLTLEFEVKNGTLEDSGFYGCYLQNTTISDSPSKVFYICSAMYNFGYEPLPVDDFKCISENFFNLTCSWKPRKNPVPTNYVLTMDRLYIPTLFSGSGCAKKPTRNSCSWAMDSKPIYYRNTNNLYFRLTGSNDFGTWTKTYNINHHSIVLAGQPELFTVQTPEKTSAVFNWTHPEHMPPSISPKVLYEIRYRNYFDNIWVVKEVGIDINTVKLTDLIPNLLYDVGLRCRCVKATNLWSNYVNLTIRTKPDVPYLPPKIVSQSFEVQNIDQKRLITLYWQGIDEKNCNAADCGYVVNIIPTNIERKRRNTMSDIRQYVIPNWNTTYNSFDNLDMNIDYEFVLYTRNKLGKSQDFASIKVAKSSKLPSRPVDLSSVSIESGYNVTWDYGYNPEKLTGFTLAWCRNKKPRPFFCTGKINWVQVLPNATSHFLKIPEDQYVYQFAVASNEAEASSGLEWVPCTVPLNRVLEKIKDIRVVSRKSNSMKVIWKLDCNAQKRVVKHYVIWYSRCHVSCNVHPDLVRCHENHIVNTTNGQLEDFVLDNLKPFSYYKIQIAAFTNAGSNEFSDPFCVQTGEAAPSDAPYNIRVLNISGDKATIQWQPPTIPNGEITEYKIYLNDRPIDYRVNDIGKKSFMYNYTLGNLINYTNYTIEISACVLRECSNKSIPETILTKIGRPGVMASPRTTPSNSSTVLVQWEPPPMPNGPIVFYQIHLRVENDPNITFVEDYNVTGDHYSKSLELQCDDIEPSSPLMISIQAVNLVDDEFVYGPISAPTKGSFCYPNKQGRVGALTIGLSIGAVLGLLILIVILYVLVRWMKGKVDTMKKFEVVLPNGLDSPQSNPMSSYENFKNGLLTNPDLSPKPAYGRLDSFVSEDSFKNRHGSGTSQFSASSTDELITKQNIILEKAKRNPSGDSSGCGSTGGHDSLSSSLTHRTNLSSDSGNEADIKNPPSPEVARDGETKETKLDENQMDGSRVSGSKDSGVDKGDDSDEKTKSPVSPYSQLSSYVDSSEKALGSYSPPAPYSKFGMEASCYVPFSRGRHMNLYGHNLANSEPSINDIQDISPYSCVKAESQLAGAVLDPMAAMQYSKFGLSRSIQDVLGYNDYFHEEDESAEKNTNGIDDVAALPYSRFGMRKLESPTTKNQPYITVGMAFAPLSKDPKEFLLQKKQQQIPWLPSIVTSGSLNTPKDLAITKKVQPIDDYNKACVDPSQNNSAYSKFGIDQDNYVAYKNAEAAPIKPGNGYVSLDDVKIMPISQIVADADNIEDENAGISNDLGYDDMILNSDLTQSLDNLVNGGVAPYSCFLTSSLKDDKNEAVEPFSLSLSENIYAPPSYEDLKEQVSPVKVPPDVNAYVSQDVLAQSSNRVSEQTCNELPKPIKELQVTPKLPETKVPEIGVKRSNGYVTLGELPSICGSEEARYSRPVSDV